MEDNQEKSEDIYLFAKEFLKNSDNLKIEGLTDSEINSLIFNIRRIVFDIETYNDHFGFQRNLLNNILSPHYSKIKNLMPNNNDSTNKGDLSILLDEINKAKDTKAIPLS